MALCCFLLAQPIFRLSVHSFGCVSTITLDVSLLQIEQLQSQCCQLEKELARKQGDADVFKREAENKLAERMRVALREQQLEYESQVYLHACTLHPTQPLHTSTQHCYSCGRMRNA